MLDMGFIPEIEKICAKLPARRQTLFFSATMAPEIQRLTSRFLRDPIKIEVAPHNSTADNIDQRVVRVSSKPDEKRAALRQLIRGEAELANAIVFSNRKRDVATLARSLTRHGFDAAGLHGDMDQKSRMETLERFRSGHLKFLIASDVAARGLDIPAVTHIFNFDVPTHAEDYIHRIGRTGRAGRSGTSITLVTPSDTKYLDAILRLINRDIPVFALDAEAISPTSTPTPNNTEAAMRPQRTRRGRRPERAEQPKLEATPVAASPAATLETNEPAKTARPASRSGRRSNSKRKDGAAPVTATDGINADSPFGTDGPVPAFLLRPATRKH